MAEKTKDVLAKELALLEEALAASRKGAEQDPDDLEWSTMIQVYEEAVAALKRIQATITDTSSLVVVIEGGLVSAVCSTDPNRIGQGFDVIDYDTDGADPADLGRVRQTDGRIAKGYISGGYIEELQVEILDEESADAE